MRPEYEAPATRKADGPLAASTLRRRSPVVAFSSTMLARELPRERPQRTTAPGLSGFAAPGGTARSGPPLPSSVGAVCEVTESVQISVPSAPTRGSAHAAEISSEDGSAGAAIAIARIVTLTHDRSETTGAVCEARPAVFAHTLAVTSPAASVVAEATERRPDLLSAMATAPDGHCDAIEYVILRCP